MVEVAKQRPSTVLQREISYVGVKRPSFPETNDPSDILVPSLLHIHTMKLVFSAHSGRHDSRTKSVWDKAHTQD